MSLIRDTHVSDALVPTLRLNLLGGFVAERDGAEITLPLPAQRLLSLLALRRRAARLSLAGTLWPEASESQAQGSLRTTIWRLQRAEPCLLDNGRHDLRLNPGVSVDVQDLDGWLCGRQRIADVPLELLRGGELLPDWNDDWVLLDRERSRQQRLHALDAAARALAEAERFAEALDLALDSVRYEPLRETAHRRVILIHLAEGNAHEAVRQYETFRSMLEVELGVPPTRALRQLVMAAMQESA